MDFVRLSHDIFTNISGAIKEELDPGTTSTFSREEFTSILNGIFYSFLKSICNTYSQNTSYRKNFCAKNQCISDKSQYENIA
jgi:hypothetical protein